MTSSPPPPPRATRAGIAEAVLEVLSERGADALSVRNVAAAAGVSVGAVQHHFPTRAALVTGAMDAVTAGFRARLSTALTDVDSAPRRLEVFCAELAALGDAGRRDAVVWTAFASRAGTDPDVREIHRREWALTEAGLQALLAAAYPDAGIDADDAGLVLAVLDGIAVARGAEGDERMSPERGRRLINATLAHFATRRGGRPAVTPPVEGAGLADEGRLG